MRVLLTVRVQERAWDLTIVSRGKSKDFWGPYIEEWELPPRTEGEMNGDGGGVGWLERWMGRWWARLLLNRFVLFPLQLYPLVGTLLSAWMCAYGSSRYLHSRVCFAGCNPLSKRAHKLLKSNLVLQVQEYDTISNRDIYGGTKVGLPVYVPPFWCSPRIFDVFLNPQSLVSPLPYWKAYRSSASYLRYQTKLVQQCGRMVSLLLSIRIECTDSLSPLPKTLRNGRTVFGLGY